ncbi:hypothetical protein BDP27DRAFT_1370681 [Rhodocollybia butyracea]|uniref:Uncharacterized protein n=1 Tax=Rhodocollybia butyracea TaxID=206335 RepID=A0A9P5P7F1_9AGAR|nr:hypothetical protein BDP27DRAFT_1370681 [Rhodocollybia butyracea]
MLEATKPGRWKRGGTTCSQKVGTVGVELSSANICSTIIGCLFLEKRLFSQFSKLEVAKTATRNGSIASCVVAEVDVNGQDQNWLCPNWLVDSWRNGKDGTGNWVEQCAGSTVVLST